MKKIKSLAFLMIAMLFFAGCGQAESTVSETKADILLKAAFSSDDKAYAYYYELRSDRSFFMYTGKPVRTDRIDDTDFLRNLYRGVETKLTEYEFAYLIGLADALYADKAVHEEILPNDKWRSIAYYKEKFLTLDGTDENTPYEPGNLFDELARISPMHLFPEYVSFRAPNRQKSLLGKEVRELHAALSGVETVKDVKVSVDLFVLHIDVWVDDSVTDADVSEIFNAVKAFVTLDNMESLSGRYFHNIMQDVHFGILDASCKAYEKVLREYRTQYSMTPDGPEPYTKLGLPQDIDGYTTWHDVQNGIPLPECTKIIDTYEAELLEEKLRELIGADDVSVIGVSNWLWIEAFTTRYPSAEDTQAALDSVMDFATNENMKKIARHIGLNAEIERIQFLITDNKSGEGITFLHPMNVFREYTIDRKRFTKEEAYQEPYAIKP